MNGIQMIDFHGIGICDTYEEPSHVHFQNIKSMSSISFKFYNLNNLILFDKEHW
jgi:hypothetical protein